MPYSLQSKAQNSSGSLLNTAWEELRHFTTALDDEFQPILAISSLEAPLLAGLPTRAKQEPANFLEIFISSVDADERLLGELLEHLQVMKRQYAEQEHYTIKIWHSGDVLPGQDWKKNIEHHLIHAHIILLLMSVKFLNSEFYHSIQLQPALDRHHKGEAWVIPVILRPCDWEHEIFGRLRPLPAGGRPVINWRPRDDA